MKQQPQYEGIKPREKVAKRQRNDNAADEFVQAIEKQTQPIGSCYDISRDISKELGHVVTAV